MSISDISSNNDEKERDEELQELEQTAVAVNSGPVPGAGNPLGWLFSRLSHQAKSAHIRRFNKQSNLVRTKLLI